MKEQSERLEQYFGVLEKKEQMEDKMTSTKEVTVDVVSCKKVSSFLHTILSKFTFYQQSTCLFYILC